MAESGRQRMRTASSNRRPPPTTTTTSAWVVQHQHQQKKRPDLGGSNKTQQKQMSGSLRQQVAAQVEEDLNRIAAMRLSQPGSLGAALSQYQPPQQNNVAKQANTSSFLDISYQPDSRQANSSNSNTESRESLATAAPLGSSSQQQLVKNRQQQQQDSRLLSIKRSPNLRLVKGLLLALMSLDLLLSLALHQFARDDQIRWLHQLRLSSLNLVATGVWFLLLAGALLYDLYRLLLLSGALHLISLIALLALSTIHLARRIDYQTVHLARLLLLLFALVLLHLYLLLMAALTLYLARGVRRRHSKGHHNHRQPPRGRQVETNSSSKPPTADAKRRQQQTTKSG